MKIGETSLHNECVNDYMEAFVSKLCIINDAFIMNSGE